MTIDVREEPIRSLRQLHRAGTFVLVNVHDAGSAALAAAAGAEALGTTSGGHAYTIGRRDAAGAISREEAIARIAEICSTVDVPVSADAENGWGHGPDDVARTVELLIEAGAAGASFEDWSGDIELGFYDRQHAVDRIAAAVETARSLDPEFVICARADRMTHDGRDAFDDALSRLQAFAEVGADCLYAPGVSDKKLIQRLVDEAGGPVNALLSVGGDFRLTTCARSASAGSVSGAPCIRRPWPSSIASSGRRSRRDRSTSTRRLSIGKPSNPSFETDDRTDVLTAPWAVAIVLCATAAFSLRSVSRRDFFDLCPTTWRSYSLSG